MAESETLNYLVDNFVSQFGGLGVTLLILGFAILLIWLIIADLKVIPAVLLGLGSFFVANVIGVITFPTMIAGFVLILGIVLVTAIFILSNQ